MSQQRTQKIIFQRNQDTTSTADLAFNAVDTLAVDTLDWSHRLIDKTFVTTR